MRIIKTKKFVKQSQSQDQERIRFINEVKRSAEHQSIGNGVRLPEYKNVEIFKERKEPAQLGLGTTMPSRVYKWSDIEPFFEKRDVQGAVQQVLQDMQELAKNPEFSEKSESSRQRIIDDAEKYERRNPYGNWSGD